VRAHVFVGLAMLAACKGGDGASSGGSPSAPSAPSASASTQAAASTQQPPNQGPPVSAMFVELGEGASGRSMPVPPCTEALVTPVRGSVNASGVQLAQGDVAAFRGQTAVVMRGEGLVLFARARLNECNAPPLSTAVKATVAPDLSFMHGAMHARLDLDDRNVAPSFYLGRLSGTAAVPEHAHAGTWELLCAVEAAGTFTLSGAPQHLGPRTCVTIPPDTKHSWQPDAGSTLSAVQMYWPPGPEQRFKKLAADELAGDH
jgi:mannose-6-phosphate isomerase-like protein (cupin superfamily)